LIVVAIVVEEFAARKAGQALEPQLKVQVALFAQFAMLTDGF
jgi:hypothetical protein